MQDLKFLFIMLGLIALATIVIIAGLAMAVCVYKIFKDSHRAIVLFFLCGVIIAGIFRFLGSRE